MTIDILAFGAHPDDVEISCGGTIAKLIRQGHKAVIIDLTQGEMGTRGTPEQRQKEAVRAGDLLGLYARENLRMPDTQIQNTREMQLPVIRKIRQYRPKMVFINAPHDRHPDHGESARLLRDAIFYAGLIKIETLDEKGRAQEPFRPAHVLHYMQDRPFEPSLIFDISSTIDIKEKVLLAYGSQLNVREPGDEPETYISSASFFDGLRARARHYGHLAGCEYGEPFLYAQPPLLFRDFESFFSSDVKR